MKVIEEGEVFSHIPPKAPDLHKSSAGKLMIVAGSRDFTGAAALACSGALRCGCGFVTLASVEEVCQSTSFHLLTPTFLRLRENPAGRISPDSCETILRHAEGYRAMVIGCGLGLDEDTQALVRGLLEGFSGPVVLDADGINAAARSIDMLSGARGSVILTPHEGEMSRLCGIPVREIHENRLQVAQQAAQRCHAAIVLKGPQTLVVSPTGEALVNHTGNSGLAKAGSGDLLSGMIGSLAAQGIDPFWAAAGGVYLHGAAADLAAARLSKFCMQPTDLLQELPTLFLRNGR